MFYQNYPEDPIRWLLFEISNNYQTKPKLQFLYAQPVFRKEKKYFFCDNTGKMIDFVLKFQILKESFIVNFDD